MGSTRILVLIVAAVAAIGLAFLVRGVFSDKPAPAPAAAIAAAPGKPLAQVLTAKRDLPIGTRLAATDMAWTPWPIDALNPAFITDGAAPVSAPAEGSAKLAKDISTTATAVIGGAGPMAQFEGAIVREPILAGEPMLQRKVVRGGEGGYLSVVLSPGKRAVSLPINVETGAGGFILPGDRVDVLQTREVDLPATGAEEAASEETQIAETVLSNIRVLAIDQNIEAPKEAKSLVGAVATLEVGPGDAETLMRAKAQGALVLSLRAYTDTGGPSGALGAPRTVGQSNIVRLHRGGSISSEAVR